MALIRRIVVAALALFLFIAPARVEARPIALAWDVNSEPSVTGYTLFYGTQSGVYTTSIDVGNLISYLIDLPGTQYYFALRAYTATGLTSPLSNEVAESSAIALTDPGIQSDAPGFSVSLQLVATGVPVSYTATNLPGGLTINASTGRISGIISAGAAASSPYLVSASASNAAGNKSSVQFTWTIAANRAPSLTNPGNQTSAQNATVSLQLSASDPNGDVLTYSATGLPASLTVNAATGLISGTLTAIAGVYPVTATVSDSVLSNSQAFTWTVTAVNQAPTLTLPASQTSVENTPDSLQLVASDPNGDVLTYSATGLPPSLTVNAATGLISGTPSFTSAGTYSVTATVSDGSLSNSKTFSWTVTNVNRAPTLTPPANQTSAKNATVSLALVASDPDGDPLTFSAVGLPTGLSINAVSGVISGTVASSAAATNSVTVTVSDGLLTAVGSFTWNVFAPGALAVDKVVFVDTVGSTTATTPAFSATTAGEILIAFVAGAGPSGSQPVTVSGAGLTWSLVKRVNVQAGTSEIWTAAAPASLANVTVTSTMSNGSDSQTLTVVAFVGAAGVGASAGASAATGAPSVLLTTTQAGSFVYGVGTDLDGGVARTVGANQTIVHEDMVVATNDAYWVQNIIAAVPTAGTQVQLNDTAPTAHQWNFAAVEILAAATVKTTPTITWAAPASITSGTALGGTQLNATASVPGTFVYTPPAGTILPVGVAQSLSVTFTPTDTTNYTNATASVAITVVRATPTITWAAPASITAGTALSATQLNATASVPGTFVYVPPAGTVLAAGAGQTLSVTFTPTNAVNYTTATASVTITVTPPAGSLAVGTIVFAEGSGTRTAGPFNTSAGDLVVAFAASSGPAAGGQSITISGGGLTWSRVTSANGMPGTAEIWQAWSPTAQTGISVTSTMSASGTTTQSVTVVTFSGAGGVGASAGLSALSGAPSVSLTTTKAGSFLYAVGNDWDAAVARTLGANQALVHQWVDTGASNTYWVQNRIGPVANAGTLVQLNDTAPTADRWNFAAVEIVAAGTGQTTPTITWAAPASITSGTALSGTQLNATASVPGTFVYTPPAGTVLPVGAAQSLSVTFTPTDTVSYTTATKSVLITVTAPSGTITAVTLLANLAAPQPPGTTITLTAAATGGTAPYQFKWFVFSTTGWTLLQDWNAAATYTWTPTITNPQAVVEVWARSAGNSANVAEKWADLPFAIQSPLTVTADRTSPQTPGTTITLTATGASGTAPFQFKWWVLTGTGWTILQDWNAAASYAWTPSTTNPQGVVEVWMRSAGNSANAPEKWDDLTFAILPPLTVTANLTAPQLAGASITLTAAAAGGTAPYQFKWWVYGASGWTVLQDWNALASYVWTPATPNPVGIIEVWMRSAGNSANAPEKWLDLPYPILSSALTVTANLAAPQLSGTNITLTVVAAGGTQPYQFKWWVYSTSGWTILQDWNVSASYVWTPATPNPVGNVEVWMRSAGNSANAPEKWVDLPYVIQ